MASINAIVDYTKLPVDVLEEQLVVRGLLPPGGAVGTQIALRASLRQDDLAHNLEPGNYDEMTRAELTQLAEDRNLGPRRTSRQTLEKLLAANDLVVLDRLRHELAIAEPGSAMYKRLVKADAMLRSHGIHLTQQQPMHNENTTTLQPLPRGRLRTRGTESVDHTPPRHTSGSSTKTSTAPVSLRLLEPEERLALIEVVMASMS